MSMWEYETLAEQSITLVADSDGSLRHKRNAVAAIHRMVSGFDVSFTHFRNTDALVSVQFFHHLPLADHPAYARRMAELKAIASAGVDAWLSTEEGAVEAFYSAEPIGERAPGLWFDVDMELWTTAVEHGLLSGLAAEPPQRWTPKTTLIELMTLAATSTPPRHSLLKMLHGFAVVGLNGLVPDDADLAVLLRHPELKTALSMTHESWIDERFDARHALPYLDGPAKAFATFWCTAY